MLFFYHNLSVHHSTSLIYCQFSTVFMKTPASYTKHRDEAHQIVLEYTINIPETLPCPLFDSERGVDGSDWTKPLTIRQRCKRI